MTLSRRTFLQSAAAFTLATPTVATQPPQVRVRLIRHATLIIQYAGKTLLVDPLFADAGTLPPINRTANQRRNPLVPLPGPVSSFSAGMDAVLVTHTHSDHWDAAAAQQIPPATLLFVQPEDARKIGDQGFSNVRPIETATALEPIRITRCGGEHGRGEVGQRMAPVSGFVLTASGWPTVYIAGDTVWCPEVARVIETHQPRVIVVNSGAAQFLEGGPITMDVPDVLQVCEAAPKAIIVAVHMEAINHCLLTRAGLGQALAASRHRPRVMIPADGETLVVS